MKLPYLWRTERPSPTVLAIDRTYILSRKHLLFEETKQGLNLEIVDQDGRSMFADGSKEPYERTRRLIEKLAVPLKQTPLRLSIAGHTSSGFVPSRGGYGPFDLSADRANAGF
jgi:chemotaxis protein MotB